MSGGSYDYLYRRDADELLGPGDSLEQLERMAARLTELGYDAIGSRTRDVIRYVDHARERVTEDAGVLRDIWHAVEWYDSADYGFDQLTKVIEEWAGARR
jgi:hypothetical protein